MIRKFLLIFVAALAVFGMAQTSQAALSAVGPINPGNGFPVYYTDANGLSLVPCLTEFPANPAANPFCVVLADPFFDAINPVVFNSNFPTEFFYWIADADKTTLPASIKVIRMAIEGTFANLPTVPLDGFQTVFQRIRIVFTPPSTGTYTFTHPFGSKTYSGTAGVLIRDTIDIPLGIPLNFTTAAFGPFDPSAPAGIAPFLQWDTGLPILDPAGNNYIGDPTVPHTVTAGPNGNFVRVAGPNIGGTNVNTVQTNLFLVAGQVWNGLLPTGLSVTRATYNRDPAGVIELDVFARSNLDAAVTFDEGIQTTLPLRLTMVGEQVDPLSARFFGKDSPLTIPALVTVSAASPAPGSTPTTVTKTVTDLVSITRAQFSTSAGKLFIEADSSDRFAPLPALTATGFGALSAGGPALPSPSQRLIASNTVPPGNPPALEPPASVTVTSAKGGSATALVSVVANIAPIAVDDTATAATGVAKAIDVLANDTDLDSTINPATLAIFGPQPANGTATAAAGVVTYTSTTPGFIGTDTFQYTVQDNLGLISNVATVTVTVGGASPPTAVNDAATVTQGATKVIAVLANDAGSNPPLTVVNLTQPAPGTGTVALNADQTVTFTSNAAFAGPTTTFTYAARDVLNQTSAAATVTVTIAANQPPVANPDVAGTSQDIPVVINVLANDSDPDGNFPLTVDPASLTQPLHGTVAINAAQTAITYTPTAGYASPVGVPDTFTYKAKDSLGAVSAAAAIVSVTVAATPPTAVSDTAVTAPGVPVIISVLANDIEPNGHVPLTVDPATLTQPLHGSVAINAGPPNTITYTPSAGFSGIDTFTYNCMDALGIVSTIPGTVTVTVGSPPVAVNDTALTIQGAAALIAVLANDTSPNVPPSTPLTVAGVVAGPVNGTAVLSGTGILYTPNPLFTGPTDTFTYQAADSLGTLSNVATVTVTVTPANVAPIAVNDVATTDQATAVTINVLANDSDPNGNPITINRIVARPANGRAAIAGNRITYTPNNAFSGVDTFTYQIRDSAGALSNIATVRVTVRAITITATATATLNAAGTRASWVVAGSTTAPAGSNINVRVRVAGGAIRNLGTVRVTAAGNFRLAVNNSGAVPRPNNPIATVLSVSTGVSINVPVTVR
jgi:hypothetical protein